MALPRSRDSKRASNRSSPHCCLPNYKSPHPEDMTYDLIARGGNSMGVAAASRSNDGATIVYMSTDAEEDCQPGKGQADLCAVPYNGKKGGAAVPVSGAATTTYNEYYPSFSAD